MWIIDFETYFDNEYSLSKMTTEAYIRDPRFEVLGMGLLYVGEHGPLSPDWFKAEWLIGEEIPYALSRMEWESVRLLCHHAHFDGLILNHHYGMRPDKWFDTLSMANLVHGAQRSKSLSALAEHYDLPAKNVPYDLFKGKHWADLTADEQRQVADGCLHDCELTYLIYDRMKNEIPPEEFGVMDITIRMFSEPKLTGDKNLLGAIRDKEWLTKNQRLYELGVGEKELASNAKFASLLAQEGVMVPFKRGKLGFIPAIAKSDAFMQELVESDDERLSALAQARLEVRSTITETRSGRLLEIAERGPLPVYLRYCAAHTRRWGGSDDTNFQNFPRVGDLRRSLRAPEGYLLACPDQSQGECRILNWLAGQTDVVERFRAGLDPYLPIASKFYGREITKADVSERNMGKVLELQSGYGAAEESIVRAAARATPPIKLTLEQGKQAKYLYRDTHRYVTALWDEAGETVLPLLADKRSLEWRTILMVEGGRLYGPTGLWIDYSGLRYEEHEWRLYNRHGGYRKMYGAKLVQNVIELLSRLVTSQAMLRYKAAGYPVVGMSHDDVWLLVPLAGATLPIEGHIAAHKTDICKIMAETPSWAPGLPLAADCKMGETYS